MNEPKFIEEEEDDDIPYQKDLSHLSLGDLRQVIKTTLANDNKYPFTKEWEWDECCYHHVE